MVRVVVLGSSNTDLTLRLPQLPSPGQTLLGGPFNTGPGGKGANQAVAARRAGADVIFLTAVGDDLLGRQALERYQGEGIDVAHAKIVPGFASGVAFIFVDDDRREHDRRRPRRQCSAHARRHRPTAQSRL